MWGWFGAGLLGAALVATPARADDLACVSTTFRVLGANDRVCISVFDDPKVSGVACHIAQARTGGVKGSFGLAEDPSRFSIACRQVGPIDTSKLDRLRSPHEVFSERASFIFKSTQVTRFWDGKRKALVYLVYTDRIIEGSPRNSISVVPLAVK